MRSTEAQITGRRAGDVSQVAINRLPAPASRPSSLDVGPDVAAPMTQGVSSAAGAELDSIGCRHLTQRDLAARWQVSERTVGRWRCLGKAPPALKLHGVVRFRMQDILAFERSRLLSVAPAASPEDTAPGHQMCDADPARSAADERRRPAACDPQPDLIRHLEGVRGAPGQDATED